MTTIKQEFPCKDCLILSTCKVVCDKIHDDIAYTQDRKCPFCNSNIVWIKKPSTFISSLDCKVCNAKLKIYNKFSSTMHPK